MAVNFPSDPSNEKSIKLTKVGEALFSFEYFAPIDQKIVLEPKLVEESNLLFYPATIEVNVDSDCVTNILFEAKSGVVLEGVMEPATDKV
jgi:hypothetical protein